MQRTFLLAILILVFASCLDKPLPPTTEVETCSETNQPAIVGTWQVDRMTVGIDTMNNSESSVTMEVTPSDWGDNRKTWPARCRFNDDGTYVSWVYDTGHKLIRKNIGHWSMKGKNLTMEEQFPSVKNMTWTVNIPCSAKYAELFSSYDFDGDGNSDDNVYYQMKRISSSAS